MNSSIQYTLVKKLLLPFYLFLGLGFFIIPANAQEQPPRPIKVNISAVYALQQLNFGSIIPTGVDGTVKILTVSGSSPELLGDVLILGFNHSPALFEVHAIPGTLITIDFPSLPLTLSSSNGKILIIEKAESSTGTPFITTSDLTYVYIGGTLRIRSIAENPSGSYFGSLDVRFTQIQQ